MDGMSHQGLSQLILFLSLCGFGISFTVQTKKEVLASVQFSIVTILVVPIFFLLAKQEIEEESRRLVAVNIVD